MSPIPATPRSVLHTDLCGPFSTGKSFLVLIDSCARQPVVSIIKSTTTGAIIKKMKSCFATHGLPAEIVTDNGSQFTSEEFKSYCSANGIKHCHVTPYCPQVNSEIVRFKYTTEKNIRANHAEWKNWRNKLDIFLLNHQSTAHSTTGRTPAVLLFGRNICTKLPSLPGQTEGVP